MALAAPRLALFDLDNTLLAGDSDHAWGEFLIEQGLVDEAKHRAQNDAFYEQYLQGELDIHGYVAFTLAPILGLAPTELEALRQEFVTSRVASIMLPRAIELVNSHRDAGDLCVIITATNEFITQPIAAAFGVEHLIATGLEQTGEGDARRYTGAISGTPCYQQGKITKLTAWLEERATNALQDEPLASLADSILYSDSFNDLPLLSAVTTAVAVDPDPRLAAEAEARGWEIRSLRG
jgi:HAD superfamily hydrolase (TIGR01490 family)